MTFRIPLCLNTLGIASLLTGAIACGQSASTHPAIAADLSGAAANRLHLKLDGTKATEKLHVIVGQSMILHGTAPMRRIYIGNPAVLQTFNGGPEQLVLTAKAPGLSSLVVWDDQGRSCLYTVTADLDPAALREALKEAYPTDTIEVDGAEERITISGAVATPEIAQGMVKLASSYSKDVVNSLRIVPVHGKQVQLNLRIAELDRSRLEQFGINVTRSGTNVFGTTTGQYPVTTTSTPTSIAVSDPLNLFFSNLTSGVGVTVRDLEQKNILQILAEPNLTTLSGQTARFLSGGEFPFPVAQGGGGTGSGVAVTIQFRPYGVKVDFTPVVNADGTIHLKISPEVSTLDFANAVSISGFTVPALATRRAETEVELKDGQSFALTGLLDRRATDSLGRVPGIANVPILGEFFKSKGLNHSDVELIMVVTASVVDPLKSTSGADKPPVEPAFPVPFLNTEKFDSYLGAAQKSEEKR